MQTRILYTDSSFIDPRWLNLVRVKRHEVEVGEDGKILLEGEKLRFKDTALPPGTKVQVWLNRYFECATMEEIKEQERQFREKQEADKQAYRDKLNLWRDEAIATNSKIKLPVKWDIGQKLVISGLLEGSHGNGINKATVNHILLLEDLNAGRLKRKKGDFLCSSKIGSFNTFHDFRDERIVVKDGEGKEYQPKVTCKCCLKILERIKDKGKERT